MIFKAYTINNNDNVNIALEIVHSEYVDIHAMSFADAKGLLNCIINNLNGLKCEHNQSHAIIQILPFKFMLSLPITNVYTKSYIISKSKLVELKSSLMGVIDG